VPIRILLAEDDFLVRQGVERALAGHPDLDVIASCDSYDTAVAAMEKDLPDVVITDIRMPPTMSDEGIRLARNIAQQHPGVGVVVLSQYDEPDYVLALLDGGSDGRAYLLKERISDVAQLTSAVRVVAAGGSVVDPRVVQRLVAAKTGGSPFDWLTPREREVLEAMASGMSNAGVAERLGIGLRSVEKHVSAIFVKLNLDEAKTTNRRVQAVLVFLAEVR
jgi:DNA-binding NarL/FixJ family response regulator